MDNDHLDNERSADRLEDGATGPKRRGRRAWLLAAGIGSTAVALALILAVPAARARVAGPLDDIVRSARERFAGDPAMERPDPVRGVRVMAVTSTRTHEERRFTGVVVARYETPVGFRIGGKIVARSVEVGQAVKAGDPLFALDPADLRAALAAAEATRAAATAQEAQAAAEERRQARLLEQGWTTQAAYDRQLAAARSAANQARAAAEQVTLARNALAYAELRAPHDGIVTALRAEAGQVVALGQPVVVLVRPGEPEALVSFPEGQVADLRDWSATARFWGGSGAPEPAVLREVAPQADAIGRTYAVRYSLPASAGTAALGSTVTVHLRRALDGAATTVPATAVLFRNGSPIVWRIAAAGDRVEAVPVAIERLGAETADVSGLAVGDRIVTLGVHRLDEGLRVRVVEGPAAAGSAKPAPGRAS